MATAGATANVVGATTTTIDAIFVAVLAIVMKQANSILNAAFLALCFCVPLWIFAHTMSDPDLWGHLKFGLDYIKGGNIPPVDPYSYVAAGSRWISHSWLFEWVMGIAYQNAQVAGLSLLKLFLSITTLSALAVYMARAGVSAIVVSTITLITTLLLAHHLIPLRPHLSTYLFYTFELIVLCSAARNGSMKQLLVLPPLFAVWANMHGGFVAGIFAMTIWCALESIQLLKSKSGRRHTRVIVYVAVLVACAAATLVTPYGLELWYFLAVTLSQSRPEITEWYPLSVWSGDFSLYLILLIFCAGTTLATVRNATKSNTVARSRLSEVGLLITAAFLPFVAFRHVPLMAITAIIASTPAIAEACRKQMQATHTMGVITLPLKVGVSIALFLLCGLLLLLIPATLGEIEVSKDTPQNAVQLLKESGVEGNLATHFDWGEYCIFHLYPALKVSIDGRREQTYSPQAQTLTINFVYGKPGWDDLLTKLPTDTVLAPKNFPVYRLMLEKAGWTKLYDDSRCGLFARTGSRVEQQLQATIASRTHEKTASLQFP